MVNYEWKESRNSFGSVNKLRSVEGSKAGKYFGKSLVGFILERSDLSKASFQYLFHFEFQLSCCEHCIELCSVNEYCN